MRRARPWFGGGMVGRWTVGTAAGWAVGWVPVTLLIKGVFDPPSPTDDFYIYPISPDLIDLLRPRLLLLATILAFAVLGACITGAAQGQVFRAHQSTGRADAWLRATVLSMGAAGLLGAVLLVGWSLWRGPGWKLRDTGPNPVSVLLVLSTVVGGIGGLVAGIAQARVLRRWRRDGDVWIVTSVVAWVSGSLVYWLVYEAVREWFTTLYSTYYVYHEGPWWLGRLGLPDYSLTMLIAGISSGLIVGAITGLALKRLLAGTARSPQELLTTNH